jgi:dUTP pyrophosphatase
MLLPRSSTGVKKNIRLSNSVGVIDAGYRGELCALVDCISNPVTDGFGETGDERAKLSEGERNFQIVGYAGYPIHVNLVDTEEDLGNTERGTGGFGSTGN